MGQPSKLNRRQLLQRMAFMFGGTLSGTLVKGVLAGAAVADIPPGQAGRFLGADEAMFLSTLADLIIPSTDTPSASEVGAVGFIDSLLSEYETSEGRLKFSKELKSFSASADKALAGSFVSAATAAQVKWLTQVDNAAYVDRDDPSGDFYRELKEMIVAGYYLSEPGATEELRYLSVPGPYQGDIPATADTRAWVN